MKTELLNYKQVKALTDNERTKNPKLNLHYIL